MSDKKTIPFEKRMKDLPLPTVDTFDQKYKSFDKVVPLDTSKKEGALKYKEKIEQRVKERDALVNRVNDSANVFSKFFKDLIAHDLETYSMMKGADALYGDSPISPSNTWNWMKHYLISDGLHFLGIVFDGNESVMPFKKKMAEASKWILRFTKEPEKEKTGLEAML